jgi:hypothetical protein
MKSIIADFDCLYQKRRPVSFGLRLSTAGRSALSSTTTADFLTSELRRCRGGARPAQGCISSEPITISVAVITGLVGAYKAYTEYEIAIVKAQAEQKVVPMKTEAVAKGKRVASLRRKSAYSTFMS